MNKPKRQEHQAYFYSLTGMTLFAVIDIVTGLAAVENTDYFLRDKDVATVAKTLFMVPRTPIGAVAVEGVVGGFNDDTDTDSDSTTVTALSQADSAFRVLNSAAVALWTDVDSFVLDTTPNFGTAGDVVELIGVPNPTVLGNWTGVDFIRSLDITPGQMIGPVPSDMEPQLVTVRQRQEQTFDISGEYVDNNTGLAVIRGREVTLMVEHHEDGGPVVSEYVLLGNAAVQDAPPSAPDNAPITIAAAGSYRRRLIFAP